VPHDLPAKIDEEKDKFRGRPENRSRSSYSLWMVDYI